MAAIVAAGGTNIFRNIAGDCFITLSIACFPPRRKASAMPLIVARFSSRRGRAVFWACAQLEPQRTALALHCLRLNGFEVYCPRLREQLRRRGRKIVRPPPLFPATLSCWSFQGGGTHAGRRV